MLFGRKKKTPGGPACPKCQNPTFALKSVSRVPKDIQCFACEPCDALYQNDPKKGLVWMGTYSRYRDNKWIDNPDH